MGERKRNRTRRAASENAVIVMNIFSPQTFRLIAAVGNRPRFFAARHALVRVLAGAKNGARSFVGEAARRGAVLFQAARPTAARAVAKTRALAAREYSRQPATRRIAPRVLVPVSLVVLTAALLMVNVSRSKAQTAGDQKSPPVAAKAAAKVVARADADFDNAEPGRAETAWGRLVADAMQSASGADLALLNAASLAPGTLSKGAIHRADIDALLAYPDDAVVVRQITGAQLRAALELAVKDFPNDSPRFLHVAGISATFDGDATHARLRDVKINGRALQDGDVLRAALPISLSQGAGGYFTVWGKADGDAKTVGALNEVIASYAAKRGHIAPDKTARIAAR